MSIFLIVLSILALAYFPFGEVASILVALSTVFISAFVLKDNQTTKKVLQPTILLGSVLSFNIIFNFIVAILQRCGMYSDRFYSSDFYDFVLGFSNTIELITTLLVIAFTILTIVIFVAKADVPVVGKMAERIVENKATSKNKKETNSDNE